MKEYYYVKNDQKIGPVSKAELKGKISQDTLIWKAGMKDWVKASAHSELKDFFQNEPPPIPNSKTQQEAPPIPGSESQNNEFAKKIGNNALILLAVFLAVGFMEFNNYESNKFYGFLFTAIAIATYYLLQSIKTYLNKGLNYNAANTTLNILIVTSIILGVATKLLIKYETKLDAMETLGTPFLIAGLVVFIALIFNVIYYYKLGKKLSKIENKRASKISTFAYTTIIAFPLMIIAFMVFEDKVATVIETFLSAFPLIFLLENFIKTDKQIA
ncbi:DUF4339 domain-containing protein [Polaribacter sp. IC073]|uniref:DUF4339 domain-containing protein n=1 Tax=Polaribacter sp. IC073 TaxID=2508540 RepID=UPI0011BEF08B|nr:DUF4339 domain-containing protein [Polaribacter sp. IC073]TXD49212.1 DUF4339 domain-containing protein [Polaribacter sp. IC073]